MLHLKNFVRAKLTPPRIKPQPHLLALPKVDQCLSGNGYLIGPQLAGMLGMCGVCIHIGLNINGALATDPHLGRFVSPASNEAGFKPYTK